MNVAFNICPKKQNIIQIQDLTQIGDEYIPEDLKLNGYSEFRYFNYKYSDTVTINCIYYCSSIEEILLDTIFNTHETTLDSIDIKLKKDGYYKVTHIIIPTIEWFNKVQKNPKFDLNVYNFIYVTDGQRIYKYFKDQLIECPIEEIIKVNSSMTTISRCTKKFFSIWKTYQCYIQLCYRIFNENKTKCIKNQNQQTNFRRDFVWMTLNIIKYHIELDQLAKAQLLLEDLNSCNGFCHESNEDITLNNSYGCNCNG